MLSKLCLNSSLLKIKHIYGQKENMNYKFK